MSREEIILKADATAGLKVKEGEKVTRGEQIGKSPEGGPVTSPVTGVVEKISFDPDRHEFVIVIKSD